MFSVTINASPIGLLFAFLGGVISILSPCVLPILPGLFGVVSSSSIDEIEEDKTLGKKVLSTCGFFTLGFTFIYVVIALATTSLSEALISNTDIATRVGGAFLLLFAVFLLVNQFFPNRFLTRESRPFLREGISDSSAVVAGGAFAFGWSPCIGPIMGGVLAYASTEHFLLTRIFIIFAYCLGLCVAMSSVVYATFRSPSIVRFLKRHNRVFMLVSIGVMVVFGFILFFDRLTWVTSELSGLMDSLGLGRLVSLG